MLLLSFDSSEILKGLEEMAEDQELIAMGKLLDAMENLSSEERGRVLSWASQKFGVEVKAPDLAKHRLGSATTEQSFDHSTDTIANALGAKSGSDVVIAAAANLHFVQGKPKFTRQELTAEMRTAPAHFKETFVNNLTTYLNGLTRADRLRLVSTDTYALSSKERQDLAKTLADL
ncbi:hypothetical protein V1294_001475 [Bradyrhizobium sp. AZCC 1678]|uniref:hypothetical protein n=1 Tax=Bradyrhizobium sp. AZCC 1678 TaxID=3117030 RepID=UPI002FEEFBBA